MRLAGTMYCLSTGGDTASSTAPIGQNPETDGTVGRRRMQKGGPDKGGIVAGGPGSGRHREVLEAHGFRPETQGRGPAARKGETRSTGKRETGKWLDDNGRQAYFDSDGSWRVYDSGKKVSGTGATTLDTHLSKGKLDASGKAVKTKASVRGTSGGQSEGSSLTARKFFVVDGQGRILHTCTTREEAEQRSAGNTYSRVKTHVEQGINEMDTPDVLNVLRRKPVDNRVSVFRRTLPFPNTPYPGSPQGR